MQNRFKSWALWVAIAALIVYVVKIIFNVDIQPQINGLLDVLCPVLVLLGIINNPTNSNNI